MAVIDRVDLATIANQSERLLDIAKNLWGLTTYVEDPKASQQLKKQIETLLDAAETISHAVAEVH